MTCNTPDCGSKMILIGRLYICPTCQTSVWAKQVVPPKEPPSMIKRIDPHRGHRGKTHFYRISPCEDHLEDVCKEGK